jgi:hypothetical protein
MYVAGRKVMYAIVLELDWGSPSLELWLGPRGDTEKAHGGFSSL